MRAYSPGSAYPPKRDKTGSQTAIGSYKFTEALSTVAKGGSKLTAHRRMKDKKKMYHMCDKR